MLVAQIAKGAPADVFASADQEAMNRAVAAGAIVGATRRDFAANRLVVVVAAVGADRRPRWRTCVDERFRRIALGSPQTVPAGRYAKEALERANLFARLEPRFVFAQNVRQVLDYVAREEADAGFVYATDAAIMADKVKVAFDVATTTPVRYPIAVVRDSKRAALAPSLRRLRGRQRRPGDIAPPRLSRALTRPRWRPPSRRCC